MAGHVVGIGAGEVGDEGGDVFGGLGAAEGDAADVFIVVGADFRAGDLGHAAVDFLPHIGTDDAGAVGVDGDSVGGEFLGCGLGESADGEFGGGIDAEERVAFVSGDGGGVDDFSFLAAVFEFFGGGLDSPKDAVDVDFKNEVDFFGGDVGEGFDLGDAGVVDHDVEAAEFFFGVIDGGENLIAFGDVGFENGGFPAEVFHLIGDGFHVFVLEVGDGDVGSFFGEAEGDGAADSLSGSGDECDFSLDIHERMTF